MCGDEASARPGSQGDHDELALPLTFCHKEHVAKGTSKPLVTHGDEGLFVTAAEPGLS